MKKHSSNAALFCTFAAATGLCIAILVWLYLKIANVGITIIWELIPANKSTALYTISMCLAGGVIIGIFHKTYGAYPQKMTDAVKQVRTEKTFPYQKLPMILLASFLSLFFGGAVGPEAGLVSLLLGLCCWAKDQFGYARTNMEFYISNNPQISRGLVLRRMLSGLLLPADQIVYDKKINWTKQEAAATGVAAGVTGLLMYEVLNAIFGRCINIPHLEGGQTHGIDYVVALILIVAGIFAGYLYHFFRKLTAAFFGRLREKNLEILNAVLGGLILGLVGSVLPMTMFSGGNDIQAIQYEYLQFTPVLLIVIGVVKLFLTNVCIESGWRGGHFFPVIFSGLSIGYGLSILLHTNQVLCVVVVSASLLATIMQQPIGALALSLVFFPFKDVGWMCLAAGAGGCIPLPPALRPDPENKGFVYNLMHRKSGQELPGKEHPMER